MYKSTRCIPALFFVALLILSAGCTAANGNTATTSSSTSVTPHSHYNAAVDFGNDTAREEFLANFDAYAENTRKDYNVPGMAVAIVKDGKIIFAKGYGVKTAGGSDPVTTDTVFEIGSTSKAFTAALAAMEVDSGRMNWSDPVVRYVPDFQMKDPWVTQQFTITDTLAQRSGLPGYWGTDLGMLGYNRSEMIHALRYADPVSSFRTEFQYQNLFFLVTAAATENTSGLSWENDLQERIFTPLNMTSASTGYDAFVAAPDHVSVHTMGVISNNTTGPIVRDNSSFNDFTTLMGPAGGINANVKDMATWTIFQMGNGTYGGKQLISPENMAYMHTPRTPVSGVMNATKMYYCQGWMYEENGDSPSFVWHNGETLGNHAMVLFVPDRDVGIVVLANDAETTLPEVVAGTFYNEYFGRDNPDISAENLKVIKESQAALLATKPVRPANATPPLALKNYVGSYTNDVYGRATVTEKNGNLSITFAKKPVLYNLQPWDGNTFAAACPQMSDDFNLRVVFVAGSDGSIGQMVLPILGNDKTAPFVRS